MHEFFNGAITPWSGSLSSIPRGWTLCDGTNGTPDLRESFIVGSADGIDPGVTGGSETHDHSFLGNSHAHACTGGNDIGIGANFNGGTDSKPSWGTTDDQDTEPPFYELAYIMEWEDW